jgi:protein TonB
MARVALAAIGAVAASSSLAASVADAAPTETKLPPHEATRGAPRPPRTPEQNAEFRAWARMLGEAIGRRKSYPAALKTRAQADGAPSPAGRVLVAFTLDRSGSIVSLTLSEGSENPEFDAAALRMVREAAPFSPPPAWVEPGDLKFVLPIDFRSGR